MSWGGLGGGYGAVIKMLLAKDGVDTVSKDYNSWTPLSLAKRDQRTGHKRLSIEQSNHLLQRWTDQMDPLAEDVTEGTQPLDDHENLSRHPENAIGSSPSISAMLEGSWTGSRSAAVSEFPLVRPLVAQLTLEETTELFRKTLEEARENTVDGLPDNEEAAFRPKLIFDLGHSKIAWVPENVVDLIKSEVERLSLSHNQIWHIPLRFAECSQLRYLNIRTCVFREIPRSIPKRDLHGQLNTDCTSYILVTLCYRQCHVPPTPSTYTPRYNTP